MSTVVTHVGSQSVDLLGTGTFVLALGAVVFGAIVYDLYRNWSAPGGE
ncbi:MAG: hypothetical protein ABEJ05_09640 [Haloglomus sp.]